MRSVYGRVCVKHPELAGKRYLPTHACIKCHNDYGKKASQRRKLENEARDQRLADLDALMATCDTCEYCEKRTLGLDGGGKWCTYCGGKL